LSSSIVRLLSKIGSKFSDAEAADGWIGFSIGRDSAIVSEAVLAQNNNNIISYNILIFVLIHFFAFLKRKAICEIDRLGQIIKNEIFNHAVIDRLDPDDVIASEILLYFICLHCQTPFFPNRLQFLFSFQDFAAGLQRIADSKG